MSIKILSQRDPKWKDIKLGFSNMTIGEAGCTATSLASVLDTTPDIVNERLKAVKGFSGAYIIWAKISEAFPQVKSATRHWSYNNDIALKNIPLLIEVSGEKLNNPRGKHWVVFIGAGKMMDVWTGVIKSSSWYGDPTGMATIELQPVTQSNDNLPELPLDEEKRLHEETRTQLRKERDEHNKTKADYEKQKTISEETKKELTGFMETLAGKLSTIVDKGEIIGAVDRLLTLEDQLNQANKKLLQEEKKHEVEKQDLKEEITKLKLEVEQVQYNNKKLIKRLETLEDKVDKKVIVKSSFNLLQWLRSLIERIL